MVYLLIGKFDNRFERSAVRYTARQSRRTRSVRLRSQRRDRPRSPAFPKRIDGSV